MVIFTKKILFWSVILGLLLLIFPFFSINAEGGITPRLSIEGSQNASKSPGNSFAVTVDVTDISHLAGYDLQVTYNPAVLHVVDINPGIIGATTIPLDGWNFIPADPPNTQGKIRIFGHLSQFSEPTNVSGSGYVVTINFNVVGAIGQSSNIDITDIEFRDNLAQSIASEPPVNALVNIVTSSRVTGIDTSKPDGSYTTGEAIDFNIAYSDVVTVNTSGGMPDITLNSGGKAVYFDGSGSSILVFRYIVAAGETSPALDYTAVNSLALNGGTIKDPLFNDTDNTLPPVGGFAGAHSILIYMNLPVINSVTPDEGVQNATSLTIQILGSYFTDATSVQMGEGITVNSFTVLDPNTITANITIDTHAAVGDRDITVTTLAGTNLLSGGFTIVRRGDANGDGIVGIADVISVELMMAQIISSTTGADANGDGSINIADVLTIELLMAGIIT